MNTWLGQTEPTWLFIILTIEALFGLYTAVILTMEYFYDAQIEEKKKKRKITKNKVKIVIDADGNPRVDSAPSDVDVSITQEGKNT